MATKTTSKKSVESKKPSRKARIVIIRKDYTLDADGLVVGRLATQIATLLRGKNKPTFLPHLDHGDSVYVKNASKLKFTGNKLDQKVYYHYSGHPGGLKIKSAKDVFAKDPGDVLHRAVWNMLPKNKLRSQMIKRLKISN